jgi:alpha-galactosidase
VSLLASSGLVFSGDRLIELDAAQAEVLKVLQKNQADAARFADFSLQHAKQYQDDHLVRQYWFNWDEHNSLEIRLNLDAQWQVLWADSQFTSEFTANGLTMCLAPNSAVVFEKKA